jgi:hypothetical protein
MVIADINNISNWQRSVWDYIINNMGTYVNANTFTLADTAYPNGCGNVNLTLVDGFPPNMESLSTPTLALDTPNIQPRIPFDIGCNLSDIKIFTIWGFPCDQKTDGLNKRLRDRLVGQLLLKFPIGAELINIKDYSTNSIIQYASILNAKNDFIVPTSRIKSDQWRFKFTVSLRGLLDA